jgi:hypothetical protein
MRLRAVAAGVAAALFGVLPLTAATPAAAAAPGPDAVQVTVLSVNPSTPVAGDTPQPLVVRLQLTNTSGQPLPKLQVAGARGDPISTQQALDAAIATPAPPDPELAGRFVATPAVTVTLPPLGSAVVDYTSTSSRAGVAAGMCVCQSRIYPLYFAVHYQPAGGPDTVVGSGQTFVPAFPPDDQPKPVQVSWVWPILEPPHRGLSDDVFTDDSLAGSVAGGRLDRLLQVVQNVAAASVPITVLIDPDLLDELAVMASGHYEVATSGGHTEPGHGAAAARAWLQRLQSVLADDPGVQLAFTAYADPDVDALSRNGLDWSGSLPSAALARVSAVLRGHQASTDLTWPVGSTLSSQTLQSLARRGTSVVLVDDHTLPQGGNDAQPQNALTRVRTPGGTVAALVTSSQIEQYVGAAVSVGGNGLSALPQLVAEVAVRAVEDGSRSHFVTITPPRYVDPDPVAATRAILDTAHTGWSTALTVHAAVAAVSPAGYGQLQPQHTAGLPGGTIDTARFAGGALPTLSGLITDAAQAQQAFGTVPQAVQRSESSAWVSAPKQGGALAAAIRARLDRLIDGVHLVRPSTGSYTFGSSDAPLPVTVTNTLDYTVQVRLDIGTVGGLAGFTPKDIGVRELQPHTTVPLHVPAHIDPVRRIKVQVQLMTGADAPLGSPLQLSVRSTALGLVGKIITFAAGGVLAVALLLRLVRRLRRRRPDGGRHAAARTPAPPSTEPVG